MLDTPFDVRLFAAKEAADWLSRDCLVLDTETTGLDDDAEIVEISVIDSKGQTVIDTLVKPRSRIPRQACDIHGITNDMVASAPTWIEVLPSVIEAIDGRDLVIYNAAYDLRLIAQTNCLYGEHTVTLGRIEQLVRVSAWCAMMAYSRFVGETTIRHGQETYRWHKLTNAARDCGVVIDGAHRALADCRMTLGVLQYMAAHATPE
jgi:DNA polymerase-3 subunit epsilon